MKITKSQLRKIIKEEVSQILSEERMSEIGKRDAAMGRDPSRVGSENPEYMAGYNMVKKAISAALEKDAEHFNTLSRDMQEQGDLPPGIKEEVGGLTRPKGGSYGSNSEALPHLLKALEFLKAARDTKSPLAQDVATFAYLSARDVQKELETLISLVQKDLPPGNKEEPAWPVPDKVTPEDEEREAEQQRRGDEILKFARQRELEDRYRKAMQKKLQARGDMPRNKKDK